MQSYRDTVRVLPMVLERLRRRAGHKTQRSAIRAIRRRSGLRVAAGRYCEWEMGRTEPTFRSLLGVLLGLGYDLEDFEAEVDLVAGRPRIQRAKVPKSGIPIDETPQQREARHERELRELAREAGLEDEL
jgi:hypothetical protein